MVSNTKSRSNNVYLQSLIAEILRTCEEQSAKSTLEIQKSLSSKYGYECAYKTVARNILGMSDHFKLLEIGLKPVRYWIDSFYEPDFKIELNPLHLQLILYAMKNMKKSSTKPLAKEIANAESALLTSLPEVIVKELKYALKAYKIHSAHVEPVSYPKNNIVAIFKAIRKRRWISAKVKHKSWSVEQRNKVKKMAIRKVYFKKGIPYIEVYLEEGARIKVLPASICNSIKILKEKVPKRVLLG